ncbi:MAG: ATP-binding cassette domain-containing protein [archaeon]
MSLIDLRNVSFTYAGGSKPSITEITLRVEKGEFVVLTGPSGCGKTTLCRILNGLVPNFYSGALAGEARIAGLDIREHPTSTLAKVVGFVFQNPDNQLFSLSVERDVAFGPENLGLTREEIRKRVEWALASTGTEQLRDMAPYELSGGQQQRVAIASVLAMQPEVMVLDEPTSFLDPKSSERILEVVEKLHRELGVTVVMVEHRLDLVSRFADRVVVMDAGRIVLDGPPSKVYGEQAYLIGIGLPRVTLLFDLLRKDGINVTGSPVTVEEAAAELRRVLRR